VVSYDHWIFSSDSGFLRAGNFRVA
jgi:hypothetical protein